MDTLVFDYASILLQGILLYIAMPRKKTSSFIGKHIVNDIYVLGYIKTFVILRHNKYLTYVSLGQFYPFQLPNPGLVP